MEQVVPDGAATCANNQDFLSWRYIFCGLCESSPAVTRLTVYRRPQVNGEADTDIQQECPRAAQVLVRKVVLAVLA